MCIVRSPIRSMRMITRSSGSGQQTSESCSSQSDAGKRRCLAGSSGITDCSAYRQKKRPARDADTAGLGQLEVVADLEAADRAALDPLDRDPQVVDRHLVVGHAANAISSPVDHLDSRLVFDYPERRRRLGDRMGEAGIDLLFLAPSSDLEYLTGVERMIPTFGQSEYAHGWVAGAFFRPGREPVFVLPRMMTLFDVSGELPGELVVVSERDDGPALFEAAARSLGETRTLAVGDRSWAETLIHLTDGPVAAACRDRVVARERASADEVAGGACRDGARCGVADATIAAVAPKVSPA